MQERGEEKTYWTISSMRKAPVPLMYRHGWD